MKRDLVGCAGKNMLEMATKQCSSRIGTVSSSTVSTTHLYHTSFHGSIMMLSFSDKLKLLMNNKVSSENKSIAYS